MIYWKWQMARKAFGVKAGWVEVERIEVECKVTPKRLTVLWSERDGARDIGRRFDRETGASYPREGVGDMNRYTIVTK